MYHNLRIILLVLVLVAIFVGMGMLSAQPPTSSPYLSSVTLPYSGSPTSSTRY